VEYVGRAPLEGSDDRKLIATLREGEEAPAPSAVRVASAKPFVPQPKPAVVETADRSPNLTEISAEASVTGREPAAPFGRYGQERPRVEAMALPPAEYGYGRAQDDADKPLVSPVSAFAPTRYAPPAAFLSGRGLY
jgi:rare lipoprotein A